MNGGEKSKDGPGLSSKQYFGMFINDLTSSWGTMVYDWQLGPQAITFLSEQLSTCVFQLHCPDLNIDAQWWAGTHRE